MRKAAIGIALLVLVLAPGVAGGPAAWAGERPAAVKVGADYRRFFADVVPLY